MFVLELIFVSAPTILLGGVTYQDANKDRPREEWPHRIAYAACTYLIHHHGRWLLWQVCTPLVIAHRGVRAIGRTVKGGKES
jgi:hypothetical protein